MSEYDAIDAMIERAAREEQDELDRAHGQHLLDIAAARMQRENGEDPALEILRRAHQEQANKE